MADKEHIFGLAQGVSQKTGLPAEWIFAQWQHETGDFSNWGATTANNFGGIKQFKENPEGIDASSPEGDNYQIFSSPEEYADYFAKYISLYKEDGVFEAKNVHEYATTLKKGGYFGADVQEYTDGMMSFMNQKGIFERNFDPAQDPLREAKAKPQVLQESDYGSASQWQQAKDKFQHNFYDSAFGGGLRALYLDITNADSNYKDGKQMEISQDDMNFVSKMFPDDYVTQKFILLNAKNPQHLAALAQTKKEDLERQQRVEQYGYGLSTAASLAGMLLSDPTTLIPVIGQEAFILKGLSRMGKLAHAVPMSRWAKYGEIAATTGALNVADRYGAEKLAGYKDQDYTSAFLLGAALSGGVSVGIDAFRHFKEKGVQKIVSSMDNVQDHIAAQAIGTKAPNEVRNTRLDIEGLHDPKFHADMNSENLKTLMEGKKVYAITKADMENLSKKWGVDFKPNAKAFYHPDGYAAIIKDNIKPGDNIDDLLLHEVGVHGGLKEFVGETTWNKLLDTVMENTKNPQGIWKDAMRRTPGGGAEEILAHYVELAGNRNNKFLGRLKGTLNAKMRDLGLSKKLSDDEILDFAHRALQREIEKAKGYVTHPDGSVTMGGLKYSAANPVNPNIIEDVIRTEQEVLMDTQGGTGRIAKIGQWFENGWFSGNLGGILRNSKVKEVAKFANTAFHDERMRAFKGTNAPIVLELQKQHIMQELSTHWHAYIVARDKYIVNHMSGSRYGRNADDMRMNVNKEVVDYLNRTYGGHKGNTTKEFDPEIKQIAEVYKRLYDTVPEIGKTSASRFGYSHANMISEDFTPSTGEIWRVFDPERRHNTINNIFGTYEDFQKGLEDYAKMFADRPVLKHDLLVKKQKDWEQLKADHDKKMGTYEKNLKEFNEKTLASYEKKVEKIKNTYETQKAEALAKWEKDVEDLKVKHEANKQDALAKWERQKEEQWLKDELRWERMNEEYEVKLAAWNERKAKGERVSKMPSRPRKPAPAYKAAKPYNVELVLPKKPIITKPNYPHKPLPPVKPQELPQRPTKVTDGELDAYIEERAKDYAYGMTDLDVSNLHTAGTSDGGLSFFKSRFPMDTSGVMMTDKGIPFSFDDHLRSYDLDAITNGYINRFAGEVAFRNYFPNHEDFKEWYQVVSQKHYGKGIDQRVITEGEKARELKALDHAIAMLRETNPPDNIRTKLQALGGFFRKIAYAQNGANFGWNQAGESGGAIGYGGLRSVLHVVPVLNDFIISAIKGADHTRALQDTVRHVFGQNVAKEVWKTNWTSRVWHERTTANSILRHMDKAETVANYLGKVTTTVNQMQRLTDWMVTGSRAEAIADSVEWAKGKQFTKLRNPFSSSKLKAAGVDQELANGIKQDILKYTKFNSKGYMSEMDVAKWQQENPSTFTKWRFLLDNQSMRTIQQATIGNTAYLTSAHDYSTFMKILLQFKDFSLRAINGSTLRALTHREADDVIAMMGSMATNTAVYTGLTWGKSYMYYHDDPGKRKEYLKKQLSPERLAGAALLRGVMTGSILGFGGDLATAAFGTESFRTTYDNSRNMFKKDRDVSDIVGDTLGQNPSFRAAEAGFNLLKAGAEGLAPHQTVTKRELSNAVKAFPLQNALPMLWVTSEISKNFPKKEPKNAYWFFK